MGSMSMLHWIIAGAVILILFGGKGKISDIMGDFAKGVKSFKKGMAEDDEAADRKPVGPVAADPLRTIDHRPNATVDNTTEQRRVG